MKLIPIAKVTTEIFLEDRHFVIPPEGLDLPRATAERIVKEKPQEFYLQKTNVKTGGE